MTIANDLAALWLDVEKEPRWEEPPELIPERSRDTSLPKTVASAALAAVAALGAMFLLVLLSRFFR
jgi:hypothetical protein